jgi:hypothetical protein
MPFVCIVLLNYAGAEMNRTHVKDEAHRLIDRLPDDATWEDLMYTIYVHQAVETGLRDSKAGCVTRINEIRNEYGLPVVRVQ